MTHTITANSRKVLGTGSARAARNTGMVPAVVYGPSMDTLNIEVKSYDLMMAMKAGKFFTTPQSLKLDGKDMQVLPRDVQRHPVSEQVIHIDFSDFDPAREVRVAVRIKAINEEQSPGIKMGGVLSYLRNDIELICRADSIPDFIEVSVADLKVGESAKVSGDDLPEGVRLTEDREFTVLNVLATRTTKGADAEEEVEGEEGAEGAEEATEGADESSEA
ncbi:MAG: 50S ribosomal protein L25/general stress protein Ctc [Pseudomonadota bacterium]|nr:50S ribosomal protein L25/general stress protein Ctc [Pseudomonadota bacterium]